ncbi:amidase [Aquabacterium sp.]|uniref:amidase n=1 Tax=Aquabacterium sp. TaxID=1872578 RepID=UPI003D6D9E98
MALDADEMDDHGAFVPGSRATCPPSGRGLLSGLRFAVKDLIDVAGVVTTGGNPDWAATHGPAPRDAPVVSALLNAGAELVGKTVTDELAFSLEGENAFHGTPRNPHAADRLPGGSSSGSAVAVAAGLVDFALGTDTGGSVRVPASFCGVFGFRPTHGRVSLEGVLPFAPSYDTVGWFARNGAMLQKVGQVLLGSGIANAEQARWHLHLVQDAFDMADAGCSAALMPLAKALGAQDTVQVFKGAARDWLTAYQVLQGDEIRQNLGAWIAQHRPTFGPSIHPRFDSIAHLDPQDVKRWQAWRHQQTQSLCSALAAAGDADGVLHALVLPTTPGVALRKDTPPEDIGRFYGTALALNALAGHTGLPQVTLPMGQHGGLPLGLSIIGPPHSDEALLALAANLPASFNTTC